jgi:hypothetical protein
MFSGRSLRAGVSAQIQSQILSSRVKRNALENKRVVNYAIFELHVSERERIQLHV